MSTSLDGLDLIEKLGRPKAKIKPHSGQYTSKAKPVEQEPDEPDHKVRVPRTVPARVRDDVDDFLNETTLVGQRKLGIQEQTDERRTQVLGWMLDGHTFGGQMISVNSLSEQLKVPLKTVENDIASLKQKMSDFHTSQDVNDVPALAHMLMEMKFQDRGRALVLYNIIMADIREADELLAKLKLSGKPIPKGSTASLTGRDRAAMYSAALTALDLSNKATNGMDALFKLTGGAQRLQQIIKVKNLQVTHNHSVPFAELQKLAAVEMGAILPSTRKVNKALVAPPTLELTEEDLMIIEGKF